MSDATKPSAASGNDQAIKWDGPEWRFAQLGSASASRPALSEATDELIDKASFF